MGNDYRNVVLELNNSLTGVKEVVDLEEEAIELVSNVYYEEVDSIYEKEVITEIDKTKINDMFNDIKKCFYKILSDNEWKWVMFAVFVVSVQVGVHGQGKVLKKVWRPTTWRHNNETSENWWKLMKIDEKWVMTTCEELVKNE